MKDIKKRQEQLGILKNQLNFMKATPPSTTPPL